MLGRRKHVNSVQILRSSGVTLHTVSMRPVERQYQVGFALSSLNPTNSHCRYTSRTKTDDRTSSYQTQRENNLRHMPTSGSLWEAFITRVPDSSRSHILLIHYLCTDSRYHGRGRWKFSRSGLVEGHSEVGRSHDEGGVRFEHVRAGRHMDGEH